MDNTTLLSTTELEHTARIVAEVGYASLTAYQAIFELALARKVTLEETSQAIEYVNHRRSAATRPPRRR